VSVCTRLERNSLNSCTYRLVYVPHGAGQLNKTELMCQNCYPVFTFPDLSVDSARGCLHHVEVSSFADVSEVYIAYFYRVEQSMENECSCSPVFRSIRRVMGGDWCLVRAYRDSEQIGPSGVTEYSRNHRRMLLPGGHSSEC
jgi:hypothetical protein